MNRQYCTYFDQHYLFMGLTLHQSLLEHAGDFKLWILCFDDETYRILERLQLERVELIREREIENSNLLAIKDTRSRVEYFWTATPDLPLYIFQHDNSVNQITYLDADLFFFASPDPIYQELGDGSILIIEHRYSREWAFIARESGVYNVSLLTFRRDANALACLTWWRERCLEWCYARYEDGKMGDQKYLEEWPSRFPGVVVLDHLGCGVAPWNVFNYRIHQHHSKVWVNNVPLVFYHFHQFKPLSTQQFDLAQRYRLSQPQIDLIYRPYIAAIQKTIRRVQQVAPGFRSGFFSRDAFTEVKRIIKRHWHILKV